MLPYKSNLPLVSRRNKDLRRALSPYLPEEALQGSLTGELPGSHSCLKTDDSRGGRNRQTRSDRNFTLSSDNSLQQGSREEHMNGQNMVLFHHSADWPKAVSFEPALDSRAGQLKKI